MDEPRSLSMPLSMRLRQWAVHHLDYPGPPISASPGSESGSTSSHEEAWSEICVGSLSQQWRYLLEHVRSKPQVHHIRGNLILEHHRQKLQQNRPSDLTLLPVIDTTLASEFKPELEDERTHLLAEYKDLTRRIQKSTLRMTQNETRIRQYRRDVRWQTDLTRKTEMELHERRKSAQLLQKFAAQARGEVSRLSAWAKDLRDLARDESERSIFRSHLPEERLFAHDGKELKTSAQVKFGPLFSKHRGVVSTCHGSDFVLNGTRDCESFLGVPTNETGKWQNFGKANLDQVGDEEKKGR